MNNVPPDGIPQNPAASFWEQNLALLRSRYPDLAHILEAENAAEQSGGSRCFFLEETPSGNPTLRYRNDSGAAPGVLIHSGRDPRKEGLRQAEAALAEAAAENAGAVIMLGLGLGYTAEAFLSGGGADRNARFSGSLIIVEKRRELFILAMKARNLAELIAPGKALFVMGEDPAAINAALLMLSPRQKPLVIKNKALTTLNAGDEAWYNEAARRVETWVSKDAINAATLKRFGKRWTRNLAANMEGVLLFPGIRRLENIARETGLPVFLAAAGPSLNLMENALEAIRERCVIIAVDTSLRFLLNRGVDPDFVVSVDPQYWNSLHLHRLRAPKTALIAESAVYPPLLRGPPAGRVFFCQSLFPLGRFIEDQCDPKGELGAGGSVATTAWDFARVLGPGSVWIAGLDLAFPAYRTHFKGALFEENAHAVSERFCPAETLSTRALENGVPFMAASARGGTVLTDKRLALYAAWFENRLQNHSVTGTATYSLAPDGLAVPGLKNGSLDELLALPVRRNDITQTLQERYAMIDKEFASGEKARAERYNQARSLLLEELSVIHGHAERAASLAKNALRAPDKKETAVILRKLDTANKAIEQSSVKDAAGFLFPPVAELERGLRETDPWKRHLEFSLGFYRSLAESADYTLSVLVRQIHSRPGKDSAFR